MAVFETRQHGIDVVSLRRIAQALGLSLPALVDEEVSGSKPTMQP